MHKTRIKDDLSGKKIGMLTVIKRVDDFYRDRKDGRREYYARWLCDCDCGNKSIIVEHQSLKNGSTRSCGCLKYRNNNKYDLSGDYGIGYTNKGDIFYFDLEDYDKIKNYSWSKTNYGYISAYIRGTGRENNKHVFMHNMITNTIDINHKEICIDHINGITIDNRKENLRIVNRTQNNANRIIQSNNTVGVTGVYFDNNRNKWFSRIELYNKIKHLGMFDNFDDAVKARKEAEEKYFGEYSYDNSRKGGDAISENLD